MEDRTRAPRDPGYETFDGTDNNKTETFVLLQQFLQSLRIELESWWCVCVRACVSVGQRRVRIRVCVRVSVRVRIREYALLSSRNREL